MSSVVDSVPLQPFPKIAVGVRRRAVKPNVTSGPMSAHQTATENIIRTRPADSEPSEAKPVIWVTANPSKCSDAAPTGRPQSDRPSRRRIYNQSRTERFEMLIQKRALRVQSARCSRRTVEEPDPPASNAFFKLDVPKWSDYFPSHSGKENISASPVVQNPAPPVTPPKSSEAQPSPGLKVNWCFIPGPVIISDRSSTLIDVPAGSPGVSTLVIGDSTLKNVEIDTPRTMVNCVRGARATDIKSKLSVLANAQRRYDRIVIHLGINEVQLRQSEISKKRIEEVCDLAKTMSDTVICSGPLPTYWGDEIFSRMLALHEWMFKWCPQNNVGFINNWKDFSRRPDLFRGDGLYPNRSGNAILSKNLTNYLNA